MGSLAEHVTCYVLDLPGYDHSDTPTRRYWVEDFATAVLDVMDSAGLDKVSTIGAHTGAIISVDLAISHPQRVRSMVMDGLPYWNKESGRLIFEKAISPGLYRYDILRCSRFSSVDLGRGKRRRSEPG